MKTSPGKNFLRRALFLSEMGILAWRIGKINFSFTVDTRIVRDYTLSCKLLNSMNEVGNRGNQKRKQAVDAGY